jgi:ATP-dependent Lon protease
MNVFEIEPPDADAARAIALRLYQKIRSAHGWGQRFDETPSDAVLERLAGLAPREMRRAWMTGFGNARLAGRAAIEVADLPGAGGRKSAMGFMQ